MEITHLNPESMHSSPAFSQGVLVSGPHSTLYVGGQNGRNPDGSVVEGGLGPQTVRALENVLTVLAEAGADQTNVVSMTITLAGGADANEGFAASAEVWGRHRTTVQVNQVAALANPEFLVEVSAVAVLPA
ncbi:RidA family protein [Agromyces salentinus]|jgi:2-iminobutanoate/2-iminopropanoate deaminase|uniref:RidA family protein n=1 Tax=Agromyces salentinus TaxID=269421 RepID=A0ABN2MGG5_9MICO|nr:RidA family protein [Agromyces salentinus]